MSTKRPSSVKVGPYHYTVSDLVDAPGKWGETDFSRHRISVLADLGPQAARSVVLHEVLHAVMDAAGLECDDAAEEALVTSLTPVLLGVLQENPDLLRYLTST